MDTHKMDKEDLFNIGNKLDKMFAKIKINNFAKFASDNKIIKRFIDAKIQGNYRHLIYECNAPRKTVYKNLVTLRKLSLFVDKPLVELTEEDVFDLQAKLNNDEMLTETTNKPVAYSYKADIVKTFKQFWAFYRVYAKYELQKDVPNIVEYLRLRKRKNSSRMVNFLQKKEVDLLASASKNLKMRALLKTFFETGARTIEILNLKWHNCQYNEQKKLWTIKLPNIKGMSTDKMPIELDYANFDFDCWVRDNTFEDEDYVFDYSYNYFRITLTKLGRKILGKYVSPKYFRKSCAMHLVNLDVNEQYIKGHMGWAANSHAISHYINQRAIKKPVQLQNASVIERDDEVEQLKMRLKQMEAMVLQKFADNY